MAGENANGKTRLVWADIYRGLCIALVVLAHSENACAYMSQFGIAAFFFISGYFSDYGRMPFVRFVLHRAYALLLPYATVGAALWVVVLALQRFAPEAQILQPDLPDRAEFVAVLVKYGDLHMDVLGASWFILALLVGLAVQRLVYSVAEAAGRRRLVRGLVFVALSGGLFLLGMRLSLAKQLCNWFFNLALVSQAFLGLGYVVRRARVAEALGRRPWLQLAGLLVTAGIAWWLAADPPELPLPSFRMNRGLIVATLAALNGIVGCLCLSMLLERVEGWGVRQVKTLLIVAGRETLGIVFFHFCAFKCVYALLAAFGVLPWSALHRLLPGDPRISHDWWWLFLAFGTCLPILLWRLVDRIPGGGFLTGRRRKQFDAMVERLVGILMPSSGGKEGR